MPKSRVAAKAVTENKQPKKIMEAKKQKMMSKSKTIKKTAPAEGGIKGGD